MVPFETTPPAARFMGLQAFRWVQPGPLDEEGVRPLEPRPSGLTPRGFHFQTIPPTTPRMTGPRAGPPSATRSTTRSSRATMGSGRRRYAAGDTPAPVGRHEIHVRDRDRDRDRGRGGDLTCRASCPPAEKERCGRSRSHSLPRFARYADRPSPRVRCTPRHTAGQGPWRAGERSLAVRGMSTDQESLMSETHVRAVADHFGFPGVGSPGNRRWRPGGIVLRGPPGIGRPRWRLRSNA